LKAKYRKDLVQKAILYMEMKWELEVNILEAKHMLTAAWNSVTPETISSCFKKAGFNYSNNIEMAADTDFINEDWSCIAPDVNTNFEEFFMCGDGVGTIGHPQDAEEICNGKEIDEEEEAEQEEESVPTFGEVVGAFEVGRKYLTSFNVDIAPLTKINALELDLLNVRKTCQKTQTYFKKQLFF
jgi:hypothetical protein